MSKTTLLQEKRQKLALENPFYGKKELLLMSQQLFKGNLNKTQVHNLLETTYKALADKADKELFYVILFATGDITNREHNLFKYNGIKNIDKGGYGARKTFIYALEWLVKKDIDQFCKFMMYITEFTNIENIFINQIRTDRKTGKVIETLSIVPEGNKTKFISSTTDYLANLIQNPSTTSVQHELIAKFLRKPKFSTRKRVNKKGEVRRSKLQTSTYLKEIFEFQFIEALSKKLNWEILRFKGNTRFIGLEKYKAKYNRNSEAYLFSSGKILDFDEGQFHDWLNKLPAGARYRVQRRLLNGSNGVKSKWVNKYGNLGDMYNKWLSQKEAASSVARELEKEQKERELSEDELLTLSQARQAAKVNTGGETLLDIFMSILSGERTESELNTIADNLLRKINIEVPVFTIVDVSGSMNDRSFEYKGKLYSPSVISKLAATIMLLKNPDPELSHIFAIFADSTSIITDNYEGGRKRNNFSSATKVKIDKLIDESEPFSQNLSRLSSLIYGGGSTNLSSFVETLRNWSMEVPEEELQRKEIINKYPVFLLISDGDLNHRGTPNASIADVKHKMKQYFGWDGLLVIWDLKTNETQVKFDNIENVIYFPFSNPQVIEQIFSKITDIDVIDIYTPLKSLYNSNRYSLVKGAVN